MAQVVEYQPSSSFLYPVKTLLIKLVSHQAAQLGISYFLKEKTVMMHLHKGPV